MTVSQRILSIMQEKRITQKQLADYSGVSTSAISDWKRKGTNPSVDKIGSISDCLGVSVDYLLGRTNDPHTIGGHSIKTGNIADNSNNNNTSVKISDSMQGKLDEMSEELLKKFDELSFDEKLDVFNYIKNKKK